MNQEDYKKEIWKYLNDLAQDVADSNADGSYDINRHCEALLCDFLKVLYNIEDLQNLNLEKVNFPAVDLGSDTAKKAFQVTSNLDSGKVKSTLNRAVQHSLQNRFNEIVFIELKTGKSDCRTPGDDSAWRGHFSFDVNQHVLTLADLKNEANQRGINDLEALCQVLYRYLDPQARSKLFVPPMTQDERIEELRQFVKTAVNEASRSIPPEKLKPLLALNDMGCPHLLSEKLQQGADPGACLQAVVSIAQGVARTLGQTPEAYSVTERRALKRLIVLMASRVSWLSMRREQMAEVRALAGRTQGTAVPVYASEECGVSLVLREAGQERWYLDLASSHDSGTQPSADGLARVKHPQDIVAVGNPGSSEDEIRAYITSLVWLTIDEQFRAPNWSPDFADPGTQELIGEYALQQRAQGIPSALMMFCRGDADHARFALIKTQISWAEQRFGAIFLRVETPSDKKPGVYVTTESSVVVKLVFIVKELNSISAERE